VRKIWPACFAVLLAMAASGNSQSPRPEGADPQIAVSPARLDFGTQAVATASQPLTITLSNNSSSGLNIDDVLTSGIDFSQSNSCGPTLAPGVSCTVSVTFRPAISGPRSGTLLIFDSAPHSPQLVALTGTGQ